MMWYKFYLKTINTAKVMLNWATSGNKNLVGYILEAIQGTG